MTASLARVVEQVFGDKVEVEHVDLFSAQASAYPEILQLVREQNPQLPLVVINGRPRFAGTVPAPQVIKALLEMGVPSRL